MTGANRHEAAAHGVARPMGPTMSTRDPSDLVASQTTPTDSTTRVATDLQHIRLLRLINTTIA